MIKKKDSDSEPFLTFREWLKKDHPDLFQQIYKERKRLWKI